MGRDFWRKHSGDVVLPETWWRYRHLVLAGIVSNRQTLSRWIANYNFPTGQMIGPNTRVWERSQVEAWMRANRPSEAA